MERIKGFFPLFIRDVPLGQVLNSLTYENYTLVFSGSYISENSELLLSPCSDGQWKLIPSNEKGQKFLNNESPEGSIEYLLNKIKEYNG